MTVDAKLLNKMIAKLGRLDPDTIRDRAASGLAGIRHDTAPPDPPKERRMRGKITNGELTQLALAGATLQLQEYERKADETRELIRELSGHKPARVSNGHAKPERKPRAAKKRKTKTGRTLDKEAMPKTIRFIESRGPTTAEDVASAFGITRGSAVQRLLTAARQGKIKRKSPGVYEAK